MVTGPDVLVVGAGVIGLTTAVHLAERGWVVEVRSECLPKDTTSAAAGAMWNLALVRQHASVMHWGRRTLDELTRLAADPRTGVRLVPGMEASRSAQSAIPDWLYPDDVRPCAPEELPPGFHCGRRYTAPLIDMPVYLEYLRGRLLDAGGCLRLRPLASFDEVAGAADVLVNCTGAQAGALVADPELESVRGQVVVTTNPGVSEFFAEEETGSRAEEMLYILPHGATVVLGGTAERGNLDRAADLDMAARILARCVAVQPLLAGVDVLAHRVGLRPVRTRIRFDEEVLPAGTRLIHCYGHGGAGVSLSWGCAEAVLDRLGTRVG